MTLSDAIEKIKPIVVQVSFMASDLSPEMEAIVHKPFINYVLGTGFFINDEGYAITAKHVIDGAVKLSGQIQAGSTHIGIGLALPNAENMRGNFRVVDFEMIDVDARHDIALLRLKTNPFKGEVRSGFVINNKELPLLFGVPVLNLNRPKDGTSIAISGYPLNEPVLVTNSGALATCWGTSIIEVPVPGAPADITMPDISDIYLADIEVNPGNSGAPIYDIENSTVIGLCTASKLAPVIDQNDNSVTTLDGKTLYYSSGLTLIVPTKYIANLLNLHKINYKSAR